MLLTDACTPEGAQELLNSDFFSSSINNSLAESQLSHNLKLLANACVTLSADLPNIEKILDSVLSLILSSSSLSCLNPAFAILNTISQNSTYTLLQHPQIDQLILSISNYKHVEFCVYFCQSLLFNPNFYSKFSDNEAIFNIIEVSILTDFSESSKTFPQELSNLIVSIIEAGLRQIISTSEITSPLAEKFALIIALFSTLSPGFNSLSLQNDFILKISRLIAKLLVISGNYNLENSEAEKRFVHSSSFCDILGFTVAENLHQNFETYRCNLLTIMVNFIYNSPISLSLISQNFRLILTLLSFLNFDERSPFAREWTILALKRLLPVPQVADFISKLNPQEVHVHPLFERIQQNKGVDIEEF
ncbi:hypothetical protein RCL1_004467 [Eukaryota sp. TZLM3-RCL]